MRKCGNCGEPGHNRRTCPQIEVIEEVEQEEDFDLEEYYEQEVMVEKPKKKAPQSNVKNVEKKTTVAENCPYKTIPEDMDLGPKIMECGHFSWWLKDCEYQCCSKAIYRREIVQEAA